MVLLDKSWHPTGIASLQNYRTGLFRSICILLLFEPLWIEVDKKSKRQANEGNEKYLVAFIHFKGYEFFRRTRVVPSPPGRSEKIFRAE